MGYITNLSFGINSETIDITTWINDGYRNYEAGNKSWSINFNTIYVPEDEGQDFIYNIIQTGGRFYTKYVPDRRFGEASGNRFVRLGVGYLTSDSISSNVGGVVTGNFAIIGSGKFKAYKETESSAAGCNFCCAEEHGTLYLNHGDTFLFPPAPEGSTNWTVEVNFQPTVSGTGDIGELPIVGTGPGTSGCPIQVTYRYFCEDSPLIPDSGGAPIEQFVEIATETTNATQLAIIAIMENETGLTIGLDGVTAEELYISWNYDFLFNNPTYILDVSGLDLSDTYLIGTFTNLTGLDISFNHLTFDDINQLDNLSLVYFDGSHNLFGQNDSFASPQLDTLVYIDLSYNYLVEVFALASSGLDIDYLDIGHNIIAYLILRGRRFKDLRMEYNTYPRDNLTGGFWEALIYDTNSPLLVGQTAPLMMKDFTICENVSWEESELEDETVDYDAIIAKIVSDKGITTEEAKIIFPYNPTYSDTASNRIPFNQLELPRGGF